MNQIIYFLTFTICILSYSSFAQKKNGVLTTSDFDFTSSYYTNNSTLKSHIFKQLNNTYDNTTSIRVYLSGECIITDQQAHQTSKSKNDLTTMLNSIGTLTYCITTITKSGDINYRTTYSGQLHVTIDEGILKREKSL